MIDNICGIVAFPIEESKRINNVLLSYGQVGLSNVAQLFWSEANSR